MKRREYVVAMGCGTATAVAGCTDVIGGDDEEYEVGNEESLVPDMVGSDWDDQDLETANDFNPDFLRGFATPEEDIIVLMDAGIEETVDDAENEFESAEATARGPSEYPLADEAFISDDGEVARCVFRESNALGEAVAARESGLEVQPDRPRATNYAEIMYSEEW